MTERFYSLSGNVLYYYQSMNMGVPMSCGCIGAPQGGIKYTPLLSEMVFKSVIYLTGYKIFKVDDSTKEKKGYFGFKISHSDTQYDAGDPEKHRYKRRNERMFFAPSEEVRAEWLEALHTAAALGVITDDFTVGKELGKGRFSTVKACTNKVTGKQSAVKIINKDVLKPDEKEFLRTEIAVLKVLNHPHLVKLEGLYETKLQIHIICELLAGGELYERVQDEPGQRLTEHNVSRCLIPLLEAIAYLHGLCIAHRDLKPENILCGDTLEAIKIADFGLAKMVGPGAKLVRACGTLSYAAPEVLINKGYGVQCDVWSVGVIVYQLLCVKLPFDGDSQAEIIDKIINEEPKLHPGVWDPLSDEAKDLILRMLVKDPTRRITAEEALHMPFIVHHRTPAASPARGNSIDSPGSFAIKLQFDN